VVLGAEGIVRVIRWKPDDADPVRQVLGYQVRNQRGYHLTATLADDVEMDVASLFDRFALGAAAIDGAVTLTVDELCAAAAAGRHAPHLAGVDTRPFTELTSTAKDAVTKAALRRLIKGGIVAEADQSLLAPWDAVVGCLADPVRLVVVEQDGESIAMAIDASLAVEVWSEGEGLYRLQSLPSAEAIDRIANSIGDRPAVLRVIERCEDGSTLADEVNVPSGARARAVLAQPGESVAT
jgi:hypothetical protein